MAVLTAGWPLLSSLVHNQRPLAAGTRLTVGSGGPNAAQFTVGRGWSMMPASSSPRQGYALSRGPARLLIRYDSLVSTGQVDQLWAGLHTVLRLTNPGLTLGQPRGVTTAQGRHGLTGRLSGNGQAGTATIIPGPSGRFAIQVLVLAPPANRDVSRGAELRLLKSLVFPVAR
jgi:hypothetical protein